MRRRHRLWPVSKTPFEPLSPTLRRWILRTLVNLGGAARLRRGIDGAELMTALDLTLIRDKWIEGESMSEQEARALLAVVLKNVEGEAPEPEFPVQLDVNLKALSRALGLSTVEARVLGFAALLGSEEMLRSALALLGAISFHQACRMIAHLLDDEPEAIQAALGPQSRLVRTGLLGVGEEPRSDLSDWISLPTRGFCRRMQERQQSPMDFLVDTVKVPPPPELSLPDYAHLQQPIELARRYLAQALKIHRPGVNILMYGPPGTGKTQLARVLSKSLRCPLYEVSSESESGAALKRQARIRALRVTQCMLGSRRALLLFDEAEDVFGSRVPRGGTKAWMNRMLEEAPVPTLWITNAVGALDRAYVRRFDLVLELKVPPRQRRAQILQAACPELLTAAQVQALAEHDDLAPAVVRRAAAVVDLAQPDSDLATRRQGFAGLIDATLKAQGYRGLPAMPRTGEGLRYDPLLVRASCDLTAVAERLRRQMGLRLCLSGPPGTGKTEFGRWISRELDRPLHALRASDLLSMWVGGTEQAIAAAFQEAERDRAILMLDEVDSFLRQRSRAVHSWEITAVNELLTQMERYDGCFIATTNRLEDVDEAALRRFDLKIRFDYLQAAQSWAIFERSCAAFGLGRPDPGLKSRLGSLSSLAPGDFAVAARRHRLGELTDAEGLLQLLTEECALKPDAPRRIGFVP